MKKILFCAGLVALASSCTQDELFNESVAEQAKGISFVADVPEALESRGELYESNNKFPFFWYAEKDIINVWASGEVTGTKGCATSGWSISSAAQYKATKSESKGQFTAASANDLLEFGQDGADAGTDISATFVAAYNANISSVTAASGAVTKVNLSVEKGNATQDYTNGLNVSHYAPMYSVTTGTKEKAYHSVGERINLEFYRPLAVARVKSSGIGAEYKQLFGKLESVKIETKGYTPGQGATGAAATPISASDISYAANAAVEVDMANLTDPTKTKVATTASGNSVVANYKVAWGDGDVAFLALANVNRKAFRDAGVKEKVVLTYDFEFADFEQTVETNADWKCEANEVLGVPALDMSNYPFFVVDNTTTGVKALIVNSGTFSSVFKSGTLNQTINWGTSGVAVNTITHLYCHVNLEDAEQALLQNFTSLKVIELSKETSLVKDAFKGLYDTMEEIYLPEVTSVNKEFVNANFAKVDTLVMGKYAFGDKTVNDLFLKKNTVHYLDASGVSSMVPVYGADEVLSFRNLTNLKHIKVNNLLLYSNAFNGCTGLTKVEGVVDITNAESAFEGCTALTEVSISSTDIPRKAFYNCTNLAKVLKGTAQVAPTTVGESAFYDCGELTTMNLANATTIGKNGFNGSGLKYASYTDATTYSDDMVVGVETVKEGAFEGTKLVRVHFKNATKIEKDILKGVVGFDGTKGTLKQVKFSKIFTVASSASAWTDTFGGDTGYVTLFVDEDQSYVDGSNLVLPYNDGTTKTTTIPFYVIKLESAE